MLLQLAQAVANATATLVLKGKNVASQCPDTAQQANVIGAAKDTAMTTSQLVACVKLVVPTISSQMCQEQVVEAAKQVAKAVGDTEEACKVCREMNVKHYVKRMRSLCVVCFAYLKLYSVDLPEYPAEAFTL